MAPSNWGDKPYTKIKEEIRKTDYFKSLDEDGNPPESTHNTREIEAWKKLAREKLAPNVTYIDPKFEKVASWAEELLNAFWVEQQKDLDAFIDTLHQELQKARTEGYALAVKHLAEAYQQNGATTVPSALEWLEDNIKYQSELDQPTASDKRDEEAHAERCEGRY